MTLNTDLNHGDNNHDQHEPENGQGQKTRIQHSDEEPSVETALLSKEETMPESAALLPQVLSVLVISFGCYIHGSSVVFGIFATIGLETESKTLLNSTTSNQTVLGFNYDPVQDSAWIIGISSIGMMIGSVLTAPLSSRLGRRWTSILGIGLVYIISYLLFVFPVNMGLLYISRLLMGVGLGVSQTLSTIYIAEVSTKDTRASLAVIPAMTGCLGVNTCQVLGKYLDYRMMSLVFTCINIPFIIMMLLIPESPTFLVSRNRMQEAEKELRRLRGGGWDVVKESLEIKKQLQGDTDNKSKEKSSLFRTELFQPHVIKPLVVSICLMFFFQMSGINLIMMYAPRIFMEVTNIDAFTANIMMGAALFVSNVVTLIIAGKCPRRIMLLISSLGCALTLAVMGVSYEITDLETECRNKTDILEQIINDADDDLVDLCSYNVDWLPVLNSMFFIFVFSLGYGSMIWMTVVEILPPSIRGWTNGLAVGWVGALSFITTFTFPYLLASVSGKVAFWIYASISFLGFLFIAMFVPETRGKTEDEIKHFFESQNKETSDKSKASELH